MQAEKFTFFGSFYTAAKMLPEDQQAEFVMGLLAYAFEGIEPSFDGPMAAMFALAKPNIDSSVKGVINGGKGGRPPKGETTKKTTKETGGKNPHGKPDAETNMDMDREVDMEMDGEVSVSMEKPKPSPASGAAEAEGSAPPSASKPVCPLCRTAARYDVRGSTWECPNCGPIKAPEYAEWGAA